MADRASSKPRHHPYQKRKSDRKQWNHGTLERLLFSPTELWALTNSQRRPVYQASLEAHVDRLHAQLDSLGPGFFPVDKEEFKSLTGLKVKACKNLVIGLEHDVAAEHKKLLVLQAKNRQLEAALQASLQKQM
ncbi:hypothetical protein FB45DRAFT_1028175 [Roridomyces roridus]|uniref:Uncharacterized protein n=1 Tax=Roridomyces roridus TaxID=1738132 RepID=A0AAD7FPI8_9AGAR|nr:hypothetical protein FB45DRAFT_1028175 [Roridomyces roridus]